MGVVITKTQGSSPVGTRAWALRLAVKVILDTGLELRILDIAVVLKREPLTLCFLINVVLDARLELYVWNEGFKLWCELQALCLSTEVVLRRGLWALRLGIAMVLRRGLRGLRFAFVRVTLISLASETWTMLSDDLSSVIFRQSTEPPPKFLKLRGWLGWVWKHFILSFWQQALNTGLTIFWDTLNSILSEFWSSWVYC